MYLYIYIHPSSLIGPHRTLPPHYVPGCTPYTTTRGLRRSRGFGVDESSIVSLRYPYPCQETMGFFRQTAASCTEDCGTIAGDITDALQANDEELTFDQLTKVETRRRNILRRSEEPFYSVLCHWDGTCLRILILDPLIYIRGNPSPFAKKTVDLDLKVRTIIRVSS